MAELYWTTADPNLNYDAIVSFFDGYLNDSEVLAPS